MRKYTRRDLLRLLTIGAGTMSLGRILTACGIKPTPVSPAPSPTFILPTNTLSPTASAPSPVATAGNTPLPMPDLVVVHGGEPEQLARQALAAFGGLQTFVPKGAKVVIKPNICVAYHTYEYAATTNPWLVGALVKMAFEAGASSVTVFDFPFGGTEEEAYAISGIADQVKAAGGKMIPMPDFKFIQTPIPQGISMKATHAFKDALDADILIDVPIAKHHSEAGLTLGMKNLMGLILNRGTVHVNLHQRIADLTTLFRPKLTVVDAIRILADHGPSGGSLKDVRKLDTVIVSPDIVAADSYATTLFDLKPESIGYIAAAARMGLGKSDLNSLRIREITVGT